MIDANLIIRRFTIGPCRMNGYLIADPHTHIGAFIDPGGFCDEIAGFITRNNINLRHLLFTHGHHDHIDGIAQFTQRFSVQGYAGKDEVRFASHTIFGNELIEVGNLRIRSLSTPGHTPGGISYYCGNSVFTGDALFCGSVGGTSSSAQAQIQLDHIRRNIFTLPDQTLVFPAHGPVTTIAAEKYANPFFN